MGQELDINELLKELETLRAKFATTQQAENKNQQQEERRLQASEESFRLLVESVKDYAIFLLDPQGYIVSWNAGAKRIKGYEAEEIIGQHFSIFYPEEDLQWGKPAWELEVATSEGRFEDEGWRIRKDGSRLWANVVITALRNEQGHLTGFAKVTRDMTERKQAEKLIIDANAELGKRVLERTAELETSNQIKDELLKREQIARTLAEKAEQRSLFLSEVSKVMISSFDYSTTLQKVCHLAVPMVGELCVIFMLDEDKVSREFELAYCQPELEEVLRKLPGEVWLAEWENWVGQVIRSGKPLHLQRINKIIEVEASIDKASTAPFLQKLQFNSAIVVPIIARGQSLGVLLFARGLSEQAYTLEDLGMVEEMANRVAQAIDNIKLYRQLQEAVQHREDFLSVAAHELKTPITSLRGFTQLLLRQIKKYQVLDLPKVELALETFEKQTEKLSHLVQRLLDISQLQRGRLALECKVTDLSELVNNVAATAQLRSEKHIIKVHTPPTCLVQADPIRFEQVVTNLVDNAIKYSPEGGLIEISLTLADSKVATLSVKDQGRGVEESKRKQIFEPFYQAHHGGFAGLGLGLFISRQIVELHKGQIEAYFPPEGGSCFVVTLPVTTEDN